MQRGLRCVLVDRGRPGPRNLVRQRRLDLGRQRDAAVDARHPRQGRAHVVRPRRAAQTRLAAACRPTPAGCGSFVQQGDRKRHPPDRSMRCMPSTSATRAPWLSMARDIGASEDCSTRAGYLHVYSEESRRSRARRMGTRSSCASARCATTCSIAPATARARARPRRRVLNVMACSRTTRSRCSTRAPSAAASLDIAGGSAGRQAGGRARDCACRNPCAQGVTLHTEAGPVSRGIAPCSRPAPGATHLLAAARRARRADRAGPWLSPDVRAAARTWCGVPCCGPERYMVVSPMREGIRMTSIKEITTLGSPGRTFRLDPPSRRAMHAGCFRRCRDRRGRSGQAIGRALRIRCR